MEAADVASEEVEASRKKNVPKMEAADMAWEDVEAWRKAFSNSKQLTWHRGKMKHDDFLRWNRIHEVPKRILFINDKMVKWKDGKMRRW